jgi:hypothetical protein
MTLKSLALAAVAVMALVSCGKQPSSEKAQVIPRPTISLAAAKMDASPSVRQEHDPKEVKVPKLTEAMMDDYFTLRPLNKREAKNKIAVESLANTALDGDTFTYIDKTVERLKAEREPSRDPREMMKDIMGTGADGQYINAHKESFAHMLESLTLGGSLSATESNRAWERYQKKFGLDATNQPASVASNPFKRSDQEVANEKLVRTYLNRILGDTKEAVAMKRTLDRFGDKADLINKIGSGAFNAGDMLALQNEKNEQDAKRRKDKEEKAKARLSTALAGLQSDDPNERAKACSMIPEGNLEQTPEVTSRLVWMLQQTNLMDQFGALSALGKMKPLPEEAFTAMLNVASGSGVAKTHAAFALYAAAPDDPRVTATFMADPKLKELVALRQKMELMKLSLQGLGGGKK